MPEGEILASDVLDAAQRISSWVHRTPIHRSRSLDALVNAEVHLKCESFQRIGAFKFRGACNALMSLDERARSKGVATHSSGNHAAAVALAASLHHVPAYVVMPRNASRVKRAAVEGYGGKVIECEPTHAAREATAAEVIAKTGATLVHPFDDRAVIAGQGTAALELLQEVPDLDVILTPVGGGGLISGTCLAVKVLGSHAVVWGAEPVGADDAFRSKQASKRLAIPQPTSIADGLLAGIGELTWPFIRDQVSQIITVDDDQIVAAMRWVWERMKMVIEPSSATVVAVVLDPRFRAAGFRRVGMIISGGNVDLSALPW
jgi:threonine dehydratase